MNAPGIFAPVDDLGTRDALSSWRWLVGPEAQVRLLTAMGDVFMVKPSASTGGADEVWLLDTYAGEQSKVAADWAEFRQRIAQPDAQVSEWVKYELLHDLHSGGQQLAHGQCFSPTLPPAIGGRFEPANFAPMSWSVHLEVSSQMHQQLQKLPPGTPVRGIDIQWQ